MTRMLVAGIDIGGTNTSFGFVDKAGNILYKDSIPTRDDLPPEEFVRDLCERIRLAQRPSPSFPLHPTQPPQMGRREEREVGLPSPLGEGPGMRTLGEGVRVLGVGIGAPNGNYFRGTIEFAPNLKWKGIVPIAEMISKHLNIPAVLTNDANAAALGEMYFGKAVGVKNFLFITLGTGLGSGIVVNGDLVYGHDGFAGELGHVIMVRDGRMCGCGRRGCLEQYVSASGLVQSYIEIYEKRNSLKLEDKENLTSIEIYHKARSREGAAIDAFNFTGDMLGFALANSVPYTSPEVIYIFGGLAEAEDLILLPTRESFDKNIMHLWKDKVRIERSGLPSNDAAILGAASVIWKRLS